MAARAAQSFLRGAHGHDALSTPRSRCSLAAGRRRMRSAAMPSRIRRYFSRWDVQVR